MTFIIKYKQFQDKNFVAEMITKSVYDTMHLEGQGLSKNEIEKIVTEVLNEPSIKVQSASTHS